LVTYWLYFKIKYIFLIFFVIFCNFFDYILKLSANEAGYLKGYTEAEDVCATARGYGFDFLH